jgi:hypothetical protein
MLDPGDSSGAGGRRMVKKVGRGRKIAEIELSTPIDAANFHRSDKQL